MDSGGMSKAAKKNAKRREKAAAAATVAVAGSAPFTPPASRPAPGQLIVDHIRSRVRLVLPTSARPCMQ
jgi:hypothetical protein